MAGLTGFGGFLRAVWGQQTCQTPSNLGLVAAHPFSGPAVALGTPRGPLPAQAHKSPLTGRLSGPLRPPARRAPFALVVYGQRDCAPTTGFREVLDPALKSAPDHRTEAVLRIELADHAVNAISNMSGASA